MTSVPPHDSGSEPQAVDIDALLQTMRPGRSQYPRTLRRRQRIVALCLVMICGTLGATLGYAWYVRSSHYRVALEQSLSERLGLTVGLGGVRPIGPSGRVLTDVRARLTADGDEVFACRHAIWEPDDRTDDDRNILTIEDGSVLVGSADWSRTEYERMLVGGLGHRFDAVGLSEVRLKNIDVRFERGAFRFTASSANGVLLIEPDGTGQASIDCTRLNGIDVDQPVNIAASFSPGEGQLPDFHRIRLAIPTMPLSALGLKEVVGHAVKRGTFAGMILYEPTATANAVTVSGTIRDADLFEFTARLPGGPYPGSLTVEVQDAGFDGDRLTHLALSGHVYNLSLRSVAPALVEEGRDAIMTLRIDQLVLNDGRVDRFVASGQCPDLSLEAVSELVGRGTVTGTATVNVRSMLVVDDVLRSADVTITARPPVDGPATISREVIAAAAERWLGFDPTAILPERVEYLELGARLTLEDGRVTVRGTHGPEGNTILTVNLFGRPFGLINAPNRTFDVPDLLALLRESAKDVNTEDAKQWWQQLREP